MLGRSRTMPWGTSPNTQTEKDATRSTIYDNLYRLAEELWKESSTTVNTMEFAYDAAGEMTSASDDNSSYDYTFDDLGRITLIKSTMAVRKSN